MFDHRRILFAPADTAGGGEPAGATGGAAAGAPAGGTGPGAATGGGGAGPGAGAGGGAPPANGAAAAGDTVKLPDKFLNPDKTPNYDNLTKSYLELERAQNRRREEVTAEVRKSLEEERVKALPATPGDYAIEEKFKLGDRDIALKLDDPMLGWLKETAHHYGVPQGEINKILQGYVGQMIAAQPSWDAEAKALGPNADARHARVDGWLKGNLSEENYKTVSAYPATARLISLYEELMTVAGSPPIQGDGGELPGEVYSRDELSKMMRDPRYSGVGGRIDNAFVAKVRAGFSRLAKN